MSTKLKISVFLGPTVIAAILLMIFHQPGEDSPSTLRDFPRADLELREDILYVKGEALPFEGSIIETFPNSEIHMTIEIRAGKPHGKSCGFYENGQLEVEEHFKNGISHGPRIRWYEDGTKKSEANIIDGKIEGTFTRWHDNGRTSALAEMSDGKPHGITESWHPDGSPNVRVTLRRGEVIERQEFTKPCPFDSSLSSR